MDSMPKEIFTALISTGWRNYAAYSQADDVHNKNKSVVGSVLSDHDDVMILFACNDID